MTPNYGYSQTLASMEMPPGLAPMKIGPQKKPWWVIDGTSMRPGFHLTPQRLWSAYRQAELGAPLLQCDTFEDILENDGHLRGQYESRLSAVAFRPWILQPGGKNAIDLAAADRLQRALRKTNMMLLLWHLMDALGFGWAGANTVWGFDPKDRVIVPQWFLIAAHRRFLINNAGMGHLTFRTELNQWPGEDLAPGEWVLAERMHRLVARAGLFRTTSWWALFKRLSITDWIVFAEKFGIPLVVGYYQDRASPESRNALLQAVTDIGSDGQAVLSDLTKIVIDNQATRNGDVSSLHPAVVATCDAEISKVITGATLNVQGGGPGSFALGKVHESRANSLVFADALWLQDVFQRYVILPFLEYNPQYANAEPPRLVIRVQPEMSPDVRVKVYQALQLMGLPIEDEQMYEDFGLRRPDIGDVLKPLYADPAAAPPTQKQLAVTE
jgi:phage gp29-like protein